ncbi:MAG: hypothetical protein JNM24_07790 [Bdellovibrionaceae bacterium]|nr:hypothetical protein [Pseudobdellovibrionaceae bacterium]
MQFETMSFSFILKHRLNVILCLFVFALSASANTFGSKLTPSDKSKAEDARYNFLVSKYTPSAATMERWEQVFTNLNHADENEMSRAVESLVTDFLSLSEKSAQFAKDALIGFHSLRRVMPPEIRWTIAALEIQNGIVNKSTLVDLRSAAIRSTVGHEKEDLISSLFMPNHQRKYSIYSTIDKGESREREELKFYRPETVAFLMTNWHLVSAIDPDNSNIEIERKRLEWFAEILEMSSSLTLVELERVLRIFNNPAMLGFTSEDRRAIFLEYGLEITKKLSHRYGRYQVNELGDMVYKKTADKRSGYGKIREIIGSWMFTDMKFLLKNVPRLQREGFFQFANLFEMKLSAADFANVKELVLSRKVDAEGYLSAAMMLLSQKGENSLSESERGQILDSTIEIITSAEHKNGLVGLSGKGLEYVRSENDFFYTTLEWFYKFTFDNKVLTNAQAKILFNTKIVRTSYLKDETYQKLDNLRLKVVSFSMDYDAYREEMTRHLAKGTNETPAEQMRLAQRLGEVLLEKDKATAGQTILDRYAEKAKWGLFGSKVNWEAERGWPVHLMIKVNPNDPDLQQHLIDVIIEQRVDSAISSGDALTYLAETKTKSPKIKEFIVRHLRFPEAGDSVSYFLTLVRLFPESSSEILSIIYRFRGDDKFVPMMKVLIDEVLKNPAMLANLKTDIQRDSVRTEAGKVYAGYNLADWLTIQVEKHKKTSCSKFYSGK